MRTEAIDEDVNTKCLVCHTSMFNNNNNNNMDVFCHRPFMPGTSLKPAVIHTAHASSIIIIIIIINSKSRM